MTTFVRITNKDIYNKIEEFIKENSVQHNEIIEHQLTTNGKVKLNRWIATTGLSITFLILGWLASHLLR